MAYSDFTMRRVVQELGVETVNIRGYFATIPPVLPSTRLGELLSEQIPLAVAVNTEKARSEWIIAPILAEIRRLFPNEISLFSGVDFEAEKSLGLSGYCDFLISLSPEQYFVRAPIIAVVEAKNENLINGLGQCIAEMVGGQKFNARAENIDTAKPENARVILYGTVTTGTNWMFLKLEGTKVTIDVQEYALDTSAQVLGILSAMVRGNV
jgi:hypothetical protein